MGNKWNTPEDLKYTKTDEWVRIEGDTATTGLTDYAQDQLNDLTYIELPEVGDSFETDAAYGTVESVKAASDLHMPVDGEITAVNEELEDEAEIANADPYGRGWIAQFKITDPSQLDGLMDAAAYAKLCEDR